MIFTLFLISAIIFATATIDASKCITQNATYGGVVGEEISFTVQMVDEYGNFVTEERSSTVIVLTLKGPEDITGNCVYSKDGLYVCTYQAKISGSYDVDLTVNGEAVPISGKAVLQPAGSVWGPNTVASGPNLEQSVAGILSLIYLETKDAFGNKITTQIPGTQIDVTILDLKGDVYNGEATSKYTDNGNYEITYNITKAGQYSMKIDVNGKPVESKASFPFEIMPGKFIQLQVFNLFSLFGILRRAKSCSL